ncbi:MAG: GtrA family protein [Acidimicrobiales bacterium]
MRRSESGPVDVLRDTLRSGRSSRLTVRFGRYTLGSVVAVVVSELTLVACYGSGLLGTTAASVVAFFAGAVPNYLLNRLWAWGRRGRLRVGREVVLYAVISAVSLVSAALATGWAAHYGHHVTNSHLVRVGIVGATYLLTYGVLFVAKFVMYQVFVFADPTKPATGATGATGATAAKAGAAQEPVEAA